MALSRGQSNSSISCSYQKHPACWVFSHHTGPHMPFIARPGCTPFWSWHQLSDFISEILPKVQCVSISFCLHWPGGADILIQRPSLPQRLDLHPHGANQQSVFHRFKGERSLELAGEQIGGRGAGCKQGPGEGCWENQAGVWARAVGSWATYWSSGKQGLLWMLELRLFSPSLFYTLSCMSVSLALEVLNIDRRGVRLGESPAPERGLLHPPCCQMILFLLLSREMMCVLYLPRNTSKFPLASKRGKREWWQAFSTYFNWQSHIIKFWLERAWRNKQKISKVVHIPPPTIIRMVFESMMTSDILLMKHTDWW